MFYLVRVCARFVHKTDGQPLTGPQYLLKLYDKDVLVDDQLGAARLDAEGRVQFSFDLSEASSADSPLEDQPDLYLVLYDGGREVFRTPVFHNTEFLKPGPPAGENNHMTQDLGTFVV